MDDTLNQKIIKAILGYIPLVVMIGYCFSTIEIYLYYELFGINVLPYLDFTEIIPHAASTILMMLSFQFLLFLLTGLLASFFKETEIKKPQPTIKTKKEIWFSYIFIGSITVLPMLTGLMLIFFGRNGIADYFDGILQIESAGFFVTIISVYTWFDYLKIKYDEHKLIFLSTITLLGLIAAGVVNSTISYEHTRYFGLNNGSAIIFQSKRITSDKNYIYIGSTVKYVFFYEVKTSGVDIYPISSVSQILLREQNVKIKHSLPPM